MDRLEKQRVFKIYVIVALMFAIGALSVGFAAFSKILKIESTATLVPDETKFKIVASGSSTDKEEGVDYYLVPTLVGFDEENVSEYQEQYKAPITVDGDQISIDINVGFSKPGQSAEFVLYVHNIGEYDTYFKSLTFNKVLDSTGTEVDKVCKPVTEGTIDADKLQQACDGISFTSYSGTWMNNEWIWGLVENNLTFTNENGLAAGRTGRAKAIISYDENAIRLDAPFTVEFGSIELVYSTNPA